MIAGNDSKDASSSAHEDISPPSTEEYKNGFIEIGEFSDVLLDNLKTAKVHSFTLEGIYCNIKCLTKQIEKARLK